MVYGVGTIQMNMFPDYYDISFYLIFFIVFNSITHSFVRFLFRFPYIYHSFVDISISFIAAVCFEYEIHFWNDLFEYMWFNVLCHGIGMLNSRLLFHSVLITSSVYYGLRGTNAFHATQINKFSEIHSPVLKDASFGFDIPCGLSLLFEERRSKTNCERD